MHEYTQGAARVYCVSIKVPDLTALDRASIGVHACVNVQDMQACVRARVCVYESRSSPLLLPLTAANATHSRTTTLTSLASRTCLLLSCDPRVRVYARLDYCLASLLSLSPESLFIRPSTFVRYSASDSTDSAISFFPRATLTS